jgi:hypothetical protein
MANLKISTEEYKKLIQDSEKAKTDLKCLILEIDGAERVFTDWKSYGKTVNKIIKKYKDKIKLEDE